LSLWLSYSPLEQDQLTPKRHHSHSPGYHSLVTW
jgi:hypothetical protein